MVVEVLHVGDRWPLLEPERCSEERSRGWESLQTHQLVRNRKLSGRSDLLCMKIYKLYKSRDVIRDCSYRSIGRQ